MFGHDDSQQQQGAELPATSDGLTTDDGQVLSAPGAPTPVDDTAGDYMEDDAPGQTAAPAPAADAPQADNVHGAGPSTDAGAVSTPVGGHPNADELLDIKQQALQQLSPLIGHLEQNPEEKFRTTMMMIQASDNDTLIKTAYEAALQIPDEKVRAQALLDIVNEINYFTHNNENNAAEA
jgi:hypothetical protein